MFFDFYFISKYIFEVSNIKIMLLPNSNKFDENQKNYILKNVRKSFSYYNDLEMGCIRVSSYVLYKSNLKIYLFHLELF